MFGRKFIKNELKSKSESNLESVFESKLDPILNDESKDVKNTEHSSVPINYDSELLKSSTSRTASLIEEILKIDNVTISPTFDYSNDQIIYPIMSTIGESPNNTMFLDDLVTDGILDKQIYEKLIVCPIHPNSISSTVRVYCPKCNSMHIEKLNLFEHKKCGHIMEGKNSFFDSDSSICPSCSKEIKNIELEIKVLAMWYKCEACSEKFDDGTLKIHCRKHNHDFDVNSGKLNNLFCYKLKTLHVSQNSDSTQIKNELVKLLNGFNFTTKQNELVKGRSGNMHEIPIYATSASGNESLLIFIKNQFEGIQESDMNYILVSMLDINPTRTLFVTPSNIVEGVENLATHYHISVISDPDFSKLLSRVEEFVSSWYTNNGVHK
jgi:ribosomal protein L44E